MMMIKKIQLSGLVLVLLMITSVVQAAEVTARGYDVLSFFLSFFEWDASFACDDG